MMRSPRDPPNMLASLHHYRAPSEGEDDSQSSSSNSPARADYEESDFFEGNNDSQSSIGVPTSDNTMAEQNQLCHIFPPVDRLPAELLMHIFSKLSLPSDIFHCMLVSKRWARNAVDLLWHRPSCVNINKHTSICNALTLNDPYFAYHSMIKRLNLAALWDLVNDGSVVALAVCTRVERLTLTNCKGLTDSGVIDLIQGNTNLLALDASMVKEITDSTMYTLASNCRKLQGLNITGCTKITSEALSAVAEACRHIKRIKLNDCRQLTDTAILALARCCQNILEIDLHQCNLIEDEPVTALLTNGRCLRELRLAGCDLITDNAFLSLPANRVYDHLRILDLTSCIMLTDRAVERIIEVAPRLRNLVLAKCRNITDVAVNAISRLGKFLHYVHLGHCGQITDAAVIRLVKSCNRIRYIDLGCCTHLTDASVMQLATLPKLRRIGLVKCSLITDESVFALANAHRTRRAAELARHQHRPNYSHHMDYRDHGEGRVSNHANSLERVHLSYCVNLTLKSILVLLNSCPKLTHLSLTGVQAFIARNDLEPYCREAPPEFTEHQRNVFCVFSGTGVIGLRKYLNEQESERLRTTGEDGGDEASPDDDDDDDETVDGDEDLDTVVPRNFQPLHGMAAVISANSQGPSVAQQHAQTQTLAQPHTAVVHDPGIDHEMTGMTDVVGEMAIDTDPENGEPDDD